MVGVEVHPPDDDVVDRLRAAGCVFAEDEARILVSTAASPGELERMVKERVGGLPLEHVVGWVEFCGQRLAVERGVFVPRRRTELVVREATSVAPPAPVIVDLCCGSGAVGAVLVAALLPAEVYAVDLDPAAVRCARRNLPSPAQVLEGDLFEALDDALRGRVELLVANAPYVPTEEIRLLPPEARLHEPAVALDGGSDGLAVLRRVVGDAARWLAPGGHVVVETSEAQAPVVADDLARAHLVPRTVTSEELAATVVVGRRPSAASALTVADGSRATATSLNHGRMSGAHPANGASEGRRGGRTWCPRRLTNAPARSGSR